MDYPLSRRNWVCRIFGHRWRRYTDDAGQARRTCSLDGLTIPPFRKVAQRPPYEYLPDDQQPAGAV
jgi:hypothetical protein